MIKKFQRLELARFGDFRRRILVTGSFAPILFGEPLMAGLTLCHIGSRYKHGSQRETFTLTEQLPTKHRFFQYHTDLKATREQVKTIMQNRHRATDSGVWIYDALALPCYYM
jgi:hypothetical protein